MSPKVQSRQNGLDRGSDYNFNNFSQGNSTIGFNDAANSSQNILVIQTHKGAATDQKNLNKSRQQNQVRELKSRKHWERKNPPGQRCLIPEEVGLIPVNKKGAIIYRCK